MKLTKLRLLQCNKKEKGSRKKNGVIYRIGGRRAQGGKIYSNLSLIYAFKIKFSATVIVYFLPFSIIQVPFLFALFE